MTQHNLLVFLFGGVIIITILLIVSVIKYLWKEKNGRSDIDNDYLFGDRPNGES
jgi:TM2 domain-containing membrane protein YozV